MKTNTFLPLSAISVFMLMLSGCSNSQSQQHQSPAGPDAIFATVGGSRTHVSLMQWDQGLQVVIADRFPSHHSHGTGSSDSKVFVQSGSAQDEKGSQYEWTIKTPDGKRAVLEIAGQKFDIAHGKLFVIKQKGQEIHVQQHDLKLPKRIESAEALTKAIKQDSEFATWIQNL